MLIEKITLRNFRVYHNEHTVMLSINPEQNVSIISGQNGFGKTSLLTSLVWGLYGKQIPDVDERYRKDIQESGGYKKYASKLFNRFALQHADEEFEHLSEKFSAATSVVDKEYYKQGIDDIYTFSVSIEFTNISIPHIICNKLIIKRTYNTKSEVEDVQILIDGRANELTKTIGQEIFINDFILPKEIAKFFFFDAEKITALAEISNLEEKQYFSKAYNEVLGIKKYVDLKQNLENLQLRIKKRSAQKGDLQKIDILQKKLIEKNGLLALHKQDLSRKEQDLLIKKADFSQIQEQLIRLGSVLSHDELQEFKRMRSQLKDEIVKNKNQFNELLELAPFAMISNKILQVNNQLRAEEIQQNIDLVNDLLQEKYVILKKAFSDQNAIDSSIVDIILTENLLPQKKSGRKILFDFTAEQRNQFKAVFDNLRNAYSKSFKTLVANSKRLQSTYNILQKKVQDAEAKDNDPVIKAWRQSFEILSNEIHDLDDKILNLRVKITILEKETTAINRQLSEQTKNIKVETTDRQKSETTTRLLKQLDSFIKQLKQRKKLSLQKSIKNELNRLMHKNDFVKQVNVIIEGNLIDIDLLDMQDQKINKDSLSKGEQQLYATALLKALVSESNIQFPVFIDSPLQKFDKLHAANIIKDFYPVISSQVVLFPLLEKELNETEYKLLFPKVGKAYLIEQLASYRSAFIEVAPQDLFNNYQQMYSRYV